ncbi:glycosyltransferase family 2 protein [Shewanella sp. 10N.7]|uniref:glycosyltransferase family 2 protein n=1 Tax=Shewanella sp. 10N.7 TaxID=2885093 RepID=UPI001E3DF644|nr:glycosyltransferase family A protein [Shewanella sp. 10N.7]MCC4831104.1 glycosyltransferase family 2 protein [Shewanella sp. 10N.7]
MEIVSVIIPTYNRVDLLKKALDSVLNQNYQHIEVVIVDDASTDNTLNFCNSLDDVRISYHRFDSSKGGNYARNFGVQKSRGSIIAFLDDDDEWLPLKLTEQLRILQIQSQVGLVYTGASVVNLEHDLKYNIVPKERGDLSRSILTYNHIGTTSSVMMRRSIFEEAGMFDIEMPQLQDYDLWIRVCQICNIEFIDRPLINYYVHTNGTQITTSVDKNKQSIEMIDKKYADLISTLSEKEQKKRFCQRYNAMGKRKLKNNETTEAIKFFIRSFMSYPNLLSIKFLVASFLPYKFLLAIKRRF